VFASIKLEDMHPGKLGAQKRIAVVMPKSAGDVLLTTAVAHSLKEHKHRECALDFITEAPFMDMLHGCPWIDQVLEFNPDMHADYARMHRLYEAYYTPFFRTQVLANWVHGGHGKSLAETYAEDCGVALGEYWCPTEKVDCEGMTDGPYITFHPGSGVGDQSARWYEHWPEVVAELKIPVVQVGIRTEPLIDGCIDMRGKTSYAGLHGIIGGAKLHLGIDSYPLHAASILGVPIVSIWGNTFPHITGPEHRLTVASKFVALQPDVRGENECFRPCHFVKCSFGSPCVNLIDPTDIAEAVRDVLS